MHTYTNFRWGLSGERQEMDVRDGRVVERRNTLTNVSSASDRVTDLGGKFLLPSFIDAHCHILPTGLDLNKLHLDGATSKEQVLQMVRDRHRSQPDGWLIAVHYNQTQLEGGVHLTLSELDSITAERPVLLEHVNGHACVANSAALAAAAVTEDSPDPAGGTYRRDASGRIDGVLLERAYEHVIGASPMPSVEDMAIAIVEAGKKMAEYGIACASDMSTGFFNLEHELMAYCLAAKMGSPIHMRLYLQWGQVFGPRAVPKERLAELLDAVAAQPTLRVDGIKIFADGGISSATAAIYGKYQTKNPPRKQKGPTERITDGQLIYAPDKLNMMVQTVHDAGYKVAIHSIGDYSTDLVFDALERTGEPHRHRIEHAMILSDSQIERMQNLNCYCTFQPEFLLRLGKAYRLQLGEERASCLIRSRSVLDAGIRVSMNSDRPIVGGDPWDGIAAASDRPREYDPTENCTRAEAIYCYTAAAADVNGDKGEMGDLLPGSLAHFQILESDPLAGP
ncbi:MAG: amidohydrolase [Fimbriimonas sp.]|nr:amidohydrolase [Fimbriimonas sp.]